MIYHTRFAWKMFWLFSWLGKGFLVSGLIYFLRIFLSSGLNLHRYFIFVYGQARFNLGLSHSFSVIKFISPTIFFKSTIFVVVFFSSSVVFPSLVLSLSLLLLPIFHMLFIHRRHLHHHELILLHIWVRWEALKHI